jgi:hypothetical protein
MISDNILSDDMLSDNTDNMLSYFILKTSHNLS